LCKKCGTRKYWVHLADTWTREQQKEMLSYLSSKLEKINLTSFPCPKCGQFFMPQITLKSKAMMICPEHGLFETDIKRSLNFRKFCSKIASKPNRSPFYYSSSELKVKRALDDLKEKYFHNVGLEINHKKYWLDFLVLPGKILSVNPSVWHKLWNREKSDNTKYYNLKLLGLDVIIIDDEILKLKHEELVKWIQAQLHENS